MCQNDKAMEGQGPAADECFRLCCIESLGCRITVTLVIKNLKPQRKKSYAQCPILVAIARLSSHRAWDKGEQLISIELLGFAEAFSARHGLNIGHCVRFLFGQGAGGQVPTLLGYRLFGICLAPLKHAAILVDSESTRSLRPSAPPAYAVESLFPLYLAWPVANPTKNQLEPVETHLVQEGLFVFARFTANDRGQNRSKGEVPSTSRNQMMSTSYPASSYL